METGIAHKLTRNHTQTIRRVQCIKNDSGVNLIGNIVLNATLEKHRTFGYITHASTMLQTFLWVTIALRPLARGWSKYYTTKVGANRTQDSQKGIE